jgi:hypothetical protein
VARAQVAEIKRRLSQKLPCAIPPVRPSPLAHARLPDRTNERIALVSSLQTLCTGGRCAASPCGLPLLYS